MDDNRVQGVENRRPSDVFLALARYRILGEQAPLEEFAELMETWAEIRRMEKEKEARERAFQDLINSPPVLTPVLTPFGESLIRTGPPEEAVSESDTEADPEPPPPKKAGTADASEAARRSFATRKQKAAAALDELRAAGVPLADIAAAAKGLTLSEVMDALERKNLALPVWVKIEKAVAKLTAKTEDADG